MTINVVVATYHAVVLGCDSLSSIVERAYFPFRGDASPARDAQGQFLRDVEGNLVIPYKGDQLVNTATNIVGGVQKMFLLHESHDPENVDCSIAAMTSGLGTLNGLVIAEIAHRFKKRCAQNEQNYSTALAVVQEFVEFVRPLWEAHVSFNETEENIREWLEDLNFLVAGYGPDDDYIKVFRVSVSNRTTVETFPDAPHCSAAWAGQSDSVASLVNGKSPLIVRQVSKAIVEALAAQRQSIVESVLRQLREQGVQVPDPFEAEVQEVIPPTLPWNAGGPEIDWANLPVQSAVDLVSTLVNAESGIQKFSMGIPMVGGRTRIGLMRRGVPFAFLNEPNIIHNNVGYDHD